MGSRRRIAKAARDRRLRLPPRIISLSTRTTICAWWAWRECRGWISGFWVMCLSGSITRFMIWRTTAWDLPSTDLSREWLTVMHFIYSSLIDCLTDCRCGFVQYLALHILDFWIDRMRLSSY